jgi:hypothetical protein
MLFWVAWLSSHPDDLLSGKIVSRGYAYAYVLCLPNKPTKYQRLYPLEKLLQRPDPQKLPESLVTYLPEELLG